MLAVCTVRCGSGDRVEKKIEGSRESADGKGHFSANSRG